MELCHHRPRGLSYRLALQVPPPHVKVQVWPTILLEGTRPPPCCTATRHRNAAAHGSATTEDRIEAACLVAGIEAGCARVRCRCPGSRRRLPRRGSRRGACGYAGRRQDHRQSPPGTLASSCGDLRRAVTRGSRDFSR